MIYPSQYVVKNIKKKFGFLKINYKLCRTENKLNLQLWE